MRSEPAEYQLAAGATAARPELSRAGQVALVTGGSAVLGLAIATALAYASSDVVNATCERLVGTLRREILDRVLILGEAHLHTVLTDYQVHYNTARPHQGISQRVPDDEPDAPHATTTALDSERIRRKPVLDGLINEYARAA